MREGVGPYFGTLREHCGRTEGCDEGEADHAPSNHHDVVSGGHGGVGEQRLQVRSGMVDLAGQCPCKWGGSVGGP